MLTKLDFYWHRLCNQNHDTRWIKFSAFHEHQSGSCILVLLQLKRDLLVFDQRSAAKRTKHVQIQDTPHFNGSITFLGGISFDFATFELVRNEKYEKS